MFTQKPAANMNFTPSSCSHHSFEASLIVHPHQSISTCTFKTCWTRGSPPYGIYFLSDFGILEVFHMNFLANLPIKVKKCLQFTTSLGTLFIYQQWLKFLCLRPKINLRLPLLLYLGRNPGQARQASALLYHWATTPPIVLTSYIQNLSQKAMKSIFT